MEPEPGSASRYSLRARFSSGVVRFAFALGFDFEEAERSRIRRRVHLGRYARYQPSELDRMTVREIAGHIRALTELIRAETPSASVSDALG